MKLTGPRREILQGGTRLFWAAGDKQRLLSKLRTVPQNVQITYTLYKAVTNIIQMSKRISQLFILNKLNIAENIPPPGKNQNKTSMAKAMGALPRFTGLLGHPGSGPMYRLNPPLTGPGNLYQLDFIFYAIFLQFQFNVV